MKTGRTTGRHVNFNRYVASHFNPFLFNAQVRRRLGCGASALALLSGIAPEKIAARKRGDHYSDNFMLRFLRGHGFRTLELNSKNVSSDRSKIGEAHVLLLSQFWSSAQNEATWVVLHQGLCYHNFDVYSLEPLSFLRKPLLSAFLILHPRWQNPAQKLPARKPPRRRGQVLLKKPGVKQQIIRSLP